MATCTHPGIGPGKLLAVGWSAGCGTDDHTGLTYKPVGTTESKTIDETSNEATVTNDDSGAYEDAILTRHIGEISVSGFQTIRDTAASSQKELRAYFRDEIQAKRQPTLWLRFDELDGDDYIYIYCLITSVSRAGSTDDGRTADYTFKMVATGDPAKPSFIEVAKP